MASPAAERPGRAVLLTSGFSPPGRAWPRRRQGGSWPTSSA